MSSVKIPETEIDFEKNPYFVKLRNRWLFLSKENLLNLNLGLLPKQELYNRRQPARKQLEQYKDLPDGDIVRGKEIFEKNCGSCHNIKHNGANGPSLENVYLKKVGYNKGYRYGELKNRNVFWTREEIFNYLTEPIQEKEYTRMHYVPYDPWDALSVIEYLLFLKSQSPTSEEFLIDNGFDAGRYKNYYKGVPHFARDHFKQKQDKDLESEIFNYQQFLRKNKQYTDDDE